ncbi:MAG: enoyl-CoA hydratase/isomerase family protein, partial [Myxococcales bacterium]|nr:enoyl-CoA hydratase/isomerase family protein [Myxococcales bacterium]
MSSVLQTHANGHVFEMALNRPEKKNAFNIAMLNALSEAYAELERRDDLWVGFLYANGDDFTAGLDLAEVGPAVASGQQLFPDGGIDPLDLTGRRRTKPVVMVVQGWCLTIGIELMLASDVCVAASNTRFSQMEVKHKIIP